MKKYICSNCAYVYDPARGEPMTDTPPGTPFEALPDAWVCPICYAPKTAFDELE